MMIIMKKSILLIFSLLFAGLCTSQVGINTENPIGIFHIDAQSDTQSSGMNVSDDVVVDLNGNVSIGSIVSDGYKLNVAGDSNITGNSRVGSSTVLGNAHVEENSTVLGNKLIGEGLTVLGGATIEKTLTVKDLDSDYSFATDKLIGADASGSIKRMGTGHELLDKLSVPSPAVFQLNEDINNFLLGYGSGHKQFIPMSEVKLAINGLSFDRNTSMITFSPGIYQITFIYEATHSNNSCTISSYFVDFPYGLTEATRIHTTAYHNVGNTSNHGGAISYTTVISNTRRWQIHLGRGQSGNCTGSGMILQKRSTQLLIFKVGS